MEKRRYFHIFLAAVGFRMVMYLAAVLIMIFQTKEGGMSLDTYLSNWCRWDAGHYLNIAENGYVGAVEVCDICREAILAKGVSRDVMEDGQHLFLVFFPLFPFVMRIFGLICSDLRLAGLVISTLAYGGGCVYMYRLTEPDYGERAARYSVILLSLFPFSFFFGGIMSESLFFLLSAAVLYYVREHKWGKVILLGALASLCRMQGALLIIPAALELLCVYRPWDLVKYRRFDKLREMFARGLLLLSMLAGTVIYLLVNWVVEGYAFSFMVYQRSHWNQGICLPTRTLSYVFRNAFSADYDLQMRAALWIPQAVLAVLSVMILLYGIRKIRASYMGYGVSYVILTYSAAWLLSAGRYLSCCIPLFVILAVMAEKRKWIMPVLTMVFLILQIIYFAGYFAGLQIM